jgi:hypothetical protein
MALHQQQAFVDPQVDYRHAELMSEVAQCLNRRPARRHVVRALLFKARHLSPASDVRLRSQGC